MYHHPKNFHFDKFTSLIQGKNIKALIIKDLMLYLKYSRQKIIHLGLRHKYMLFAQKLCAESFIADNRTELFWYIVNIFKVNCLNPMPDG